MFVSIACITILKLLLELFLECNELFNFHFIIPVGRLRKSFDSCLGRCLVKCHSLYSICIPFLYNFYPIILSSPDVCFHGVSNYHFAEANTLQWFFVDRFDSVVRSLTNTLSWQVREENLMKEVVTVIFEQVLLIYHSCY